MLFQALFHFDRNNVTNINSLKCISKCNIGLCIYLMKNYIVYPVLTFEIIRSLYTWWMYFEYKADDVLSVEVRQSGQ